MSEHTYTLDSSRPDLRVTRDDGRTAKVSRREGMICLEVKDHDLYRDIPEDVRTLGDELGEDRVQGLYDRAQSDFWRWVNDPLAGEHGFGQIYSEGRSSGWLAVDGTEDWENEAILNPEDDDERANRQRLFDFFFAALDAMEDHRQQWYESIKEAHTAYLRTPGDFTVGCFPIYTDGSSGDAISEATTETLAECLALVEPEAQRWLDSYREAEDPDAKLTHLELTVNWSERPPRDYDGLFAWLKDEYEPKALSLLRKVRDLCIAAGLQADEPTDASADDWRWEMGVWTSDKMREEGKGISVAITLEEEREHDGGEGWGMGWALSAIGWEGQIIAELRPYNYTPEVWVDARESDEVLSRWSLIEDSNIAQIPQLIKEAK